MKKHYKYFYDNFDGLHFAAHSHHPWPDCTFEAQKKYWQLSNKLLDHKWNQIFSKHIPEFKKNVCDLLNTQNNELISFAGNTHDFLVRIFSLDNFKKPIRILTSDSEFHSFNRQVDRMKESGQVELRKIGLSFDGSFENKILEELEENEYDYLFLSHTFFNSGYILQQLNEIVQKAHSKNITPIIDGYHALGAIPVDLSKVEGKLFYLGGSYKYLQGGEGAAFCLVPNMSFRPMITGWMADFNSLDNYSEEINYSKLGNSFLGATFDPSGIFRFNAVCKLYQDQNMTIEKSHSLVKELQRKFIESMESHSLFGIKNLLISDLNKIGNFITYKLDNASQLCTRLKELGISVDSRSDRLRFGFGLYQDQEYVEKLIGILKTI